ncbi:phospholipase-like protein [Tanacetum coccineum]
MNVPTSPEVHDACFEHVFQGLNSTLALTIGLWMGLGNMMNEVDIENLTIEQYLMLTQENQAHRMARTKSGRMITKDIENMTIAEYMGYEAEIKRDPWGYAQPCTRSSGSTTLERSKPLTKDTHEPLEKDPNDFNLSAPNSHHEDEEVSFDKDVDEWLNAEMSKRMTGQDNEEEEDALINILKTVVEECKSIYKKAQIKAPSSRTSKIQGISFVTEEEEDDSLETLPCQLPPKEMNLGSFTLPCTIGNLKLYVMVDLGASVNVMPKSLFEHLKLADLKETSMVVEMTDMTKKAPLGIVENILVKIDKFLFHSYIVVIDMLEGRNKTVLLGRPFLATIHAQIDVFRREISLGIGALRYENKNIDDVTRERRYFKWVARNYDFNIKSRRATAYAESYDFHHEYPHSYIPQKSNSPPNDTLRINTYFPDVFQTQLKKPRLRDNSFEEWLVNKYELKAGRKRYALDEVWEKCEKFHDTTKLWYDKGFEEEELWQNKIEEIDYTPVLVKSETFEVYRYTFKNRKSFISKTKQMDDVLTLGRVNGSRFMEKTRKEMDEEKRTTRKT